MKNHGYLRHLANFGYVVEAGSLSAAARRMGVSPSVLSDSVRILETRMGQPLLERGRTGVRPTAQGTLAMAEAQEVIAALDRLMGPEPRADMTGPVTITLGEELVDWFAPAIAALQADHPDLHLALKPENTRLDELRHTRDLYIRITRDGDHGGLTTLQSWPIEAGLFAAPDLLADPLTASIAEIEAQTVLTAPIDGDACTLRYGPHSLRFPRYLAVDGIAPRIALARRGVGLVPCLAPTAHIAPKLARIRPDLFTVGLICTIGTPLKRPTNTLTRIAEALAEAAQTLK